MIDKYKRVKKYKILQAVTFELFAEMVLYANKQQKISYKDFSKKFNITYYEWTCFHSMWNAGTRGLIVKYVKEKINKK